MSERGLLQAVMDAISALELVKAGLEGQDEIKPVLYRDGPTDLFFCGSCRGAVIYGDRYCKMCGKRIGWDK